MTDERFSVEVTIAAPVEEVWTALREPERIRRWHGWHYDDLDKEIDVIYGQNVTESATEHWMEVQGGDRFELTGLDGHTRLRMTRAPRGGDPEWDAYYEDVNEGWITFIQQLKFALERHAVAERRTVFLSGTGSTPVLAATGLAAACDLPPGSPYELTAPTGEPLSGETWFRSANQAGLTVAGWGDGLLVAGQTPPSTANPHGGAMMVLTTYGLDDAAFTDLETRWTTWWTRTFPSEPTAG